MATIKSYTNIEQSKVLAKILPLESVDMFFNGCVYPKELHLPAFNKTSIKDIPCWSLTALLSVLPEIKGGKPMIALDDNWITYPHINDLHTKENNLIDTVYKMIIKLHELNLL